jgi:DNA-binding MarR family transcriptional regulator
MKSYALIHQLIELVETFEKQSSTAEQADLSSFAGFLNLQLTKPNDLIKGQDPKFGNLAEDAQQQSYQIDNNIGKLFVYMSRYAKSYIKKALTGSPLQSAEDFTALAILLTHPALSKTDLINLNLQEKTSGTEVINRLISNGLVRQWQSEADKRGKTIGITEEGKVLLYRVFSDMNHVGKMVTGNLTFEEKLNLQYLLQKLEDFHYTLHQQKTIKDKEALLAWEKPEN